MHTIIITHDAWTVTLCFSMELLFLGFYRFFGKIYVLVAMSFLMDVLLVRKNCSIADVYGWLFIQLCLWCYYEDLSYSFWSFLYAVYMYPMSGMHNHAPVWGAYSVAVTLLYVLCVKQIPPKYLYTIDEQ